MCMIVKDKLTSFRLVTLLLDGRRSCMREYFALIEHGRLVFIGNSIEYQSVLCRSSGDGVFFVTLSQRPFSSPSKVSSAGGQLWSHDVQTAHKGTSNPSA